MNNGNKQHLAWVSGYQLAISGPSWHKHNVHILDQCFPKLLLSWCPSSKVPCYDDSHEISCYLNLIKMSASRRASKKRLPRTSHGISESSLQCPGVHSLGTSVRITWEHLSVCTLGIHRLQCRYSL